MKILIIVSTLGLGGNEKSAINIYKCLKEQHNTKLVTFESRGYCPDDSNVIDIKVPATRTNVIRAINSIKRILRISRIIRENDISVIFCMTNENNPVSLFRFKGVKKIVSCRDCGNLIRHTDRFYRMRIKSDHLVFNSNYMRDYYLSKYPLETSVVSTIYNIVDIESISSESSDAINEDEFFQQHYVLISVGRFCKEKGYNHLIRIFEETREIIADLGLVIVGDGELFPKVKQMVENCRFKNDILLLGNQSNPYKYIAKSKMFLLTSITEGFPNVLLEALALEIPIISTNCTSGPSEILETKNNYYSRNEEIIFAEYGVLTPALEESSLYDEYELSKSDVLYAQAIIRLYDDKEMYDYYKSVSKLRALDFTYSAFEKNFSNVLATMKLDGDKK